MSEKVPSVEEVLDSIIEKEKSSGVKGAICLDRNGFTMGSRGELLNTPTAHIVGVANGSARLESASELQVVSFETTHRTISIGSRGDHYVALVARLPVDVQSIRWFEDLLQIEAVTYG
eukprot:CAMPEP_0169175510 /NCGR_PEP_ID=MMETSP1015-20121227/65300_1 /TAXON_ID=342587 /ORGANISM="Karlodinium micrum, Strain CCMP2283" /LENGTH=117 /DNA_ID=CAMNT_0009249805 /DNA_START=53 /DNA_END=403 /DNA_ORIENTATION=-